MELSEQVHDLLQRVKVLTKQSKDSLRSEKININRNYEIVFTQDDLINIDDIDFSNDETWLCESTENSKVDLNRWLYEDMNTPKDLDFHSHHISLIKKMAESKKNIDTRTFTRPKKKYVRPSIEKYNEELYEIDKKYSSEENLSQEIHNYILTSKTSNDLLNTSISDENMSTLTKPLYFDLSQPVTGGIFDKILSNESDIDSFQNMSPPSLVNSMCSSTFTNLMENSFIKNDPVLREIRDADYSSEILIQDADPPLFQSFTESCSSLNSDSAESFLKRTLPALNATFQKNSSQDKDRSDCPSDDSSNTFKNSFNSFSSCQTNDRESLNSTYRKPKSKECNNSNNLDCGDVQIEGNLNNTFKRNITKDISYEMSSSNNSDVQSDAPNLNGTFMKPKNNEKAIEIEPDVDSTYKDSTDSSVTDVFFNTAMSGSTTQKNLSYDNLHSENIDPNTTIIITPPRHNGTFRKSTKMNSTFHKINDDRNTTYINNLSKDFNKSLSLENHLDSQTLNDHITVKNISFNIKDELKEDPLSCNYEKDIMNHEIESIRNSVGYVTGSTDSLDHMSSLSNSSRGSNRMLNMAEVDAIVEQQERSLQVMSTPKPAKSMSKLFENHLISPIVRQKEHVSDSDLSSTDDYLAVCALSKASSGHSEKNLKVLDRNVKSLSNLRYNNADSKYKTRSINAIKPVSNLKTLGPTLKGSYTTLKSADSNLKGSYTNLRTIGGNLKGSYTNLKPVGQNLPVITSKPNSAPVPAKKADMNVTHTVTTSHSDELFKVPPVPTPSIKSSSAPTSNICKPQARNSCLPRPVGTGIPRPVSKIPGPRSLRPSTSRPSTRPSSRTNVNDGYF